MNTIFIYFAGVGTLPIIGLFVALLDAIGEWRERRRYQRAWDKFSAEFDKLTGFELAELQVQWGNEEWRYGKYASDRDRYFAMKWKGGFTTEI